MSEELQAKLEEVIRQRDAALRHGERAIAQAERERDEAEAEFTKLNRTLSTDLEAALRERDNLAAKLDTARARILDVEAQLAAAHSDCALARQALMAILEDE